MHVHLDCGVKADARFTWTNGKARIKATFAVVDAEREITWTGVYSGAKAVDRYVMEPITLSHKRRPSVMSAEENKEKARRLMEEAFGQGKKEVIDEVLHSDFVCYDPNSESGQIRGADTIKGEIEYFRSAVPDLTYTVEDQVAEGDKVVTRYTARGTHQGEFFGVAGTGNRIEMSGIQIDRFDESGKMIEEWPEYDLLGAMRQIGAIPEPG